MLGEDVETQEVLAWTVLALAAAAVFWIGVARPRTRGVFFLAPFLFAGLVYWAIYDEDVKPDFYDATAQVIPVLILALVIDKSLFHSRIGGKYVAGYLVLLLIVGEGAALYALGRTPSDGTAVAVTSMLLVAALLLTLLGAENVTSERHARDTARRDRCEECPCPSGSGRDQEYDDAEEERENERDLTSSRDAATERSPRPSGARRPSPPC